MAEYWVVNGHRPDCAYMRSLDEPWEPEAQCDCDDDEVYAVIDDEVYADGDYDW